MAATARSCGQLSVSINLSALQFTRPDLVDVIATTLDDSGADASSIHFEITESILMEDIDSTATALARLKALGVGLMIDDFGTGYSSLSYLKRFPVDGLKVDQSFVRGLGSDSGDSAIVAAVVNLAHTLGLVAVAEGVETAAQFARLGDLCCDFAQGYYLAYPQPAENIFRPELQHAAGRSAGTRSTRIERLFAGELALQGLAGLPRPPETERARPKTRSVRRVRSTAVCPAGPL